MRFNPEIFAGVRFSAAQSGAEARAVQTPRALAKLLNLAKRLDCGAFTAAVRATKWFTENLPVMQTTERHA
jgi:hypothetical protein